jgi:branched-subunit amino acid aminotransferase/4-amino-4-deoxychorismate lyase
MNLLAVAIAGRGLVDPDAPVFRADDESLLRGSAAFETLPTYGGVPFLLDRHLDRLRSSIEALALPPADGVEELVELVVGAAAPDHVLRIYRTELTLLATAAALPDDLEEARARGLGLVSVELDAPELLVGVKSTSYAAAFAARRFAEEKGADDALFVAGGVVRELPTANVWWRAGEQLFTPAVGTGVLPGVTRSLMLELTNAVEGQFPLSDLLDADEAFTTSSIREVMPVVSLDGRTIGDGRPGKEAARLQAALRLRSRP